MGSALFYHLSLQIDEIKLIRNHETGRSQGYGFISVSNRFMSSGYYLFLIKNPPLASLQGKRETKKQFIFTTSLVNL